MKEELPKTEQKQLVNPHVRLDGLEVRVESLEGFRDRVQDVEKELLITLKVMGRVLRWVGRFFKWNIIIGVGAMIAHFAGIFEYFK